MHDYVYIKTISATDEQTEEKKQIYREVFEVTGDVDFNKVKFKIKADRISIKFINFLKIVNYEHGKDKESMHEVRSIELECNALIQYIQILNGFLVSFPTSSTDDSRMLAYREYRSTREYWAIMYRREMKMLIQKHIVLAKIAHNILKRLESKFTFDFACSRVHDLEDHGEMLVNRLMIGKYLNKIAISLKEQKLGVN